jgi:hypothetical protein
VDYIKTNEEAFSEHLMFPDLNSVLDDFKSRISTMTLPVLRFSSVLGISQYN